MRISYVRYLRLFHAEGESPSRTRYGVFMAKPPERTGSERLAERLRSLRGSLSQQQAAEQAGISHGTWQNLERAITRAQPLTLKRIANGFAVDYDELWSYVVENKPVDERFTDAELERLAARLAPMIARHLRRQID